MGGLCGLPADHAGVDSESVGAEPVLDEPAVEFIEVLVDFVLGDVVADVDYELGDGVFLPHFEDFLDDFLLFEDFEFDLDGV